MTPPPAIVAPRFHHVWGGVVQRVFVLDAQRAWTGEEGGRIGVTTDGGATWRYQPTPNEIDGYVRSVFFVTRGPQAGKRGWATGSNGRILTTSDGGLNWALSGAPLLYPAGDPFAGRPMDLFDVVFLDAQNGWVAGIRALLKTTDGGQTWTDLLPLNPHLEPTIELYRMSFFGIGPSLPAVAVAEPGTILRSTDGTNWTRVVDGAVFCTALPVGLEMWDVHLKPSANPDTAVGYAVGGQGNQCGGFMSTTDGGQTWTMESILTLPPTVYGITALAGPGALACGYGGRAYSRQSAQDPEWLDISSQLEPPKPGVRIPVWGAGSDGNATAWLVGLMNHVYKTSDAGVTWTKQRGAGAWRIRDIHFVDDQRGWGAAQNVTVLRTQDGGVTWIEELLALGGPNLNTVRMRDATHGFAAGDSLPGIGPLVYYYDPSQAPNSWRESALGPPPAPLPVRLTLWSGQWVVRGGIRDAWLVGTSGTVLRSTDGNAQTWSYFASPPGASDVELLSATFDGVDAVYCAGVRPSTGAACAYRLRYPALAWEDLSPGFTATWRAIVAQGSDVYAVGSTSSTEGAVHKLDPASPPGAPQWDLIVPAAGEPAPQVLTTAAFVGLGVNRALFVGGERGAVLRFQGGIWSSLKSQTSVNLSGMSFLSSTRGFVVGHGSIDGKGVGSGDGLGDSALVGYS